jgi:hypothetical protein
VYGGAAAAGHFAGEHDGLVPGVTELVVTGGGGEVNVLLLDDEAAGLHPCGHSAGVEEVESVEADGLDD